jgi:predicted RNase H-like nuclease (RuvC/YqgF family)
LPPSNKNNPAWRKRLQALSGRKHNKDDPTVIYMAGYLHCTHLNSRVESLEQRIKELKEENPALQNSLKMVEGEEANTCEAYRTLKKDYAKKLKKGSPHQEGSEAFQKLRMPD